MMGGVFRVAIKGMMVQKQDYSKLHIGAIKEGGGGPKSKGKRSPAVMTKRREKTGQGCHQIRPLNTVKKNPNSLIQNSRREK